MFIYIPSFDTEIDPWSICSSVDQSAVCEDSIVVTPLGTADVMSKDDNDKQVGGKPVPCPKPQYLSASTRMGRLRLAVSDICPRVFPIFKDEIVRAPSIRAAMTTITT